MTTFSGLVISSSQKRQKCTEWIEQMKRFVGGRLWKMSKKRKKKEREMGQAGQSSKN